MGSTCGRYGRWLVNNAHGDGICTYGRNARVDDGIRAGGGDGVKSVDQILNGAEAAVAVIFQLNQSNHICIDGGQGGDDFVALLVELGEVVCATGGGEAAAAAVTIEVVEDVVAGNGQTATDGIGGGSAWVAVYKVDDPGWL